MHRPIKKIVIVGGGSAGWMSASLLIKQFSHLDITLIESSDVPTVGVGESTLGSINIFLHLLGLKDEDWMQYCNATYKLGIKFTDFNKIGEEFYYPFGDKDFSNTKDGITDWLIKKAKFPDTPINDFYESYYSVMPLIYESKICDNKENRLPYFNWTNDVAYHMDAALFGKYLKEEYCLPKGVNYKLGHIEKVTLDSDGYISKLILKDSTEVTGDLFIDCTGFTSLLLEKTLGVPFESYNDVLPNNKAWAVPIPYTNKELEMENVTNCTAIENGWVWNTPLYNRIGSGYVYCDKFISDEEALNQFKEYLDGPKMKFPKQRSKDLDFRKIEIKNGIHKQAWYKNCVAIGLSYGFIEPLESTGLFTIHELLLKLSYLLQHEQINKIHIDSFNYAARTMLTSFRSFVAWHYLFSSRRDTPYWRYVTEFISLDERIDDKNFIELNTETSSIAVKLLGNHTFADHSTEGMPDILIGLKTFPMNNSSIAYYEYFDPKKNNSIIQFDSRTQVYWNQKKMLVNQITKKSSKHYHYLKEKIYSGRE